jgi:serine/threonine protein kinase
MYYALTGQPPFSGKSAIDTITKHLSQPPPEIDPALKIPPDLKMIILKALEKQPEDRYASMDQLAVDLKKLTKGVSVEHRPLARERLSDRKRLIIMLCFVVSFVVMYAISIGLQSLLEPSTSRDAAKPQTVREHEKARSKRR